MEEQNDLEKFIHVRLQKLPEHQAPRALVDNVLIAIAKRQALPWWKQPFTFWPRRVQNVLFVTLFSVFFAVLYGAGRAAERVAVPDVSSQLSSYAWIGRTARAIGEALLLSLGTLSLKWLAALALVFFLLYGACLAAGVALFRVTGAAGSHAG